MRVTSMASDVQYQIQQSQQNLATANQQLATGMRVNQLSDDPTGSAELNSQPGAVCECGPVHEQRHHVVSQM